MRAGFTSARLTQNALQALYARQVNVLGLIFNCVDTEMPDYYLLPVFQVLRGLRNGLRLGCQPVGEPPWNCGVVRG